MKTVLELIETQLDQLNFLETDLNVVSQQIRDDRLYLEQEIEIHEENGNLDEANKYYEELDLLVYPLRKIEADIRNVKKSLVEDYAELILTTTGDVSLANNVLKAKRNYVQSERIINALKRKFNN